MTTDPLPYTAGELLAVMSARLLRDGQIVFAGVGIPLLAATLAQRLHGPGLTILFEGGTIGAYVEPGQLPPSTNEQRCTRRANMVLGSTDVLLLLQRGYVDVGFMGGAQIDQYGNLNSSFIGSPERPTTRLPGTGGGNDIASLTQMIVAMKHEKRRFVERVDFVTSPGFLSGGGSRREAGLVAGGMFRVVTDLGLLGFDEESKRMTLLALHPGVAAADVQANTGFELLYRTRPAGDRAADRTRIGGVAPPRPRPPLHRLKLVGAALVSRRAEQRCRRRTVDRRLGGFGHKLSPSVAAGASNRLGSSRRYRAAVAMLPAPVNRNRPGTLTPAARSAIVANAATTIAAALTILLAAIVRARSARGLAACSST